MTNSIMIPQFDLSGHPPSDTIRMLTGLLERITAANDELRAASLEGGRRQSRSSADTCFHARSIPSIDIQAYLVRILKYCPCTNECFLSLLVYFDRMARNSSRLRIDSYNIHRLVISGVMVASKFFSDVFFTNSRYAKVGGLPVAELNELELEFLRLNDFNLNVSVEELQQYGDQLMMHWVREEERRRESCRRKEARTQYAEGRTSNRLMETQPRCISVDPYQPRRQSHQSLHETMAYYSERLGAHKTAHTTMYNDIERSMARVYESKRAPLSKYSEGIFETRSSSYPQYQSCQIEQQHRLPTPPHHSVSSKEAYFYSSTHLHNDS